MTITLEELREDIQRRLGDESAAIWTADEIDGYVQTGYDRLTLETGMLWTSARFDQVVKHFTYTQAFEAEHATSGFVLAGPAQFTSLFERDYIDNADGPANHNYSFEFNGGYVADVTTVYISPLVDMPENLYQIERATWNNRRIEPLRSRDIEMSDGRYELNSGQVDAYIADKDGLRKIRLWRIPSSPTVYSVASDSDSWGLLRDIDAVDTSNVEGTWGDIVSVPDHEADGGPWGIIRRFIHNDQNLKLEYTRRGAALDEDSSEFEIPDRYVAYVRWFALAEALGREGDGQDVELSAHYRGRYQVGVERVRLRRANAQPQRKTVRGGSGMYPKSPPKARLPYQYGHVVR